MTDDLLPHYNRELAFLRKLGAEFADANPKIAGRLRLSADGITEDPHVARLIEAVAFLNARIRRKLDDDFPELTQALLGVLHPHYLAPIPSMAIVQFTGQADATSAFSIPRGSLLETAPVEGEVCRFTTGADADVLPVEIESAKLTGRPLLAPAAAAVPEAVASLRVVLRCRAPGVTFAKLSPKSLRFFLRGASEQSSALYELLLNDCVALALARAPDDPAPRKLRTADLRPVGLGADEGLLPCPAEGFPGYRLLTEYFAFPEKFSFVEISGLGPAAFADFGPRLEVFLYLRRTSTDLEREVSRDSLALGCVPIVNLFAHRAEPIRLQQTESEVRVVPDAGRPLGLEVWSVDRVRAISREGEVETYDPFFSVRHATRDAATRKFWNASRSPSPRRGDRATPGTEVDLAIVDLDLRPSAPADRVIEVETTCLNRDLPSRLPFGGAEPRLSLLGAAPLERIACLTRPTPTLRPPLGRGALWRLVSHLSLNHLSISGPGDAAEALREILKLYDFRDSAETRATIDGLVSVRSRPTAGRAPSARGGGICRGVEVRVELDPARFSGGGLFLFASVLERFLGLSSSVNSFTRTVAVLTGREGELRRWPPRAGERVLL